MNHSLQIIVDCTLRAIIVCLNQKGDEMSEITLRELCKEYGVSRRAVQGYEKIGLVSPSGKTPQGYLLYDEVVQKRIHTIYRLQQFGFQLKEVKALAGKPNAEIRKRLEEKRSEMIARQRKYDDLIQEISLMIDALQ